MYDLVIKGGTLVDGSGRPSFTGDVAIMGDRIAAVGQVKAAKSRRQIDADGLVVTPGWVDIHTHYDGQLTWDPEVSPSGWHGVTTIVAGNCGVGFAPARPDEREWLIGLMEGVEDIPGTALAEGMSWNWESFPEYLDEIERLPRVLDVAALVPHGALRAYILGAERANEAANNNEIERMARLLSEAIASGAIGFSSTRTLLHRAKSGELAAGTTAAPDELIALGRALGGSGHRVFSLASDMADIESEFQWMAKVSRQARVPVTYQVLQPDFAPSLYKEWIDRGVAENRKGSWLVPQVAGKPTSLLLGFDSTFHPFSAHSTCKELAHLPLPDRVARLKDPSIRDAMLAERVDAPGMVALALASFHKTYPLGDPPDYEPDPSKSVAAIAAREGRQPIEVAYDLMMARDGQELLYLPIFNYAASDLEAVREMITHPATVLGLGDGGAHCGVLCDASLPTFMVTHWTRDRVRGPKLPLEAVVQLQTQRTAELYGFDDRGLLAPGWKADLNLIDMESLQLTPPQVVRDLPAQGRRLVQGAVGYVATIKSGVVVREHDEPTGLRPGTLLRGPQARPV